MCGIAGICVFKNESTDLLLQKLQKMSSSLYHRGPDDEGIELVNLKKSLVGLVHRRLSILDLSELGHQPMFSNCGNYVITFNGEIYNFLEIKTILLQKGYSFRSNTDTEVILYAYQEWGNEFVEKLIGMFAFAILDKIKHKLLLYRDRAGVKPLYYYFNNEIFLFASELRAIIHSDFVQKKIDINSLGMYLQMEFIPTPFSIIENVFKLNPGSYLELDLIDKSLRKKEYWNVYEFYLKPKIKISFQEAVEKLENLFVSAFSYRMIADVPVGVFLSGGYDSSAVTAILSRKYAKIKTFTIGFKEKEWDESEYAKKISKILETEHYEYICSSEDAQKIIKNDIAALLDEPMADQSSIPTLLVSELAKKYVKVVLSADGGDETFAGYNRYPTIIARYEQLEENFKKYENLVYYFSRIVKNNKLKTLEQLLKYGFQQYISLVRKNYTDDEVYKLLNIIPSYKNSYYDIDLHLKDKNISNLAKFLAIEYKTYMMDDCLMKVDRCTMYNSIEGREPLLDHRIIEFVAQLPDDYKIHKGEKKYILKQLVHRHISKEIMDRPKMGFSIPLIKWLYTDLKDITFYYTSPEFLNKHHLLRASYVKKMQHDFFKKFDYKIGQKLWQIILFNMWYEKIFKS